MGDVIQRLFVDAGAGIRPDRSGGVLLDQDLAELLTRRPSACPWTTIAHPN